MDVSHGQGEWCRRPSAAAAFPGAHCLALRDRDSRRSEHSDGIRQVVYHRALIDGQSAKGANINMSDPLAQHVIDSRRLLYFYHVAKNGGFSRAEAAVGAPQPVISRHITKLEEELGVQLLDRHGRGVTLTQFGEILFRRAEIILEEMASTIAEIDTARRQPVGQVSIAGPATMMSLYMPEIIKRFRADLPDVELIALQPLTGEIYNQLVSGKVDVAILMQIPNKTRFGAQELTTEPLVAVTARTHPLAQKTSITRAALATERMVLPSMQHGLRALINQYFSEESLSPQVHLQIDSIPLIKAVVADGELLTILPQSTARLEFPTNKFASIRITPPVTRSLYACYQHEGRRANHVRVLVKHVKQVFKEKTTGKDSK
ncbi:LysR family transcriptional regulator [Steroidobacter flavus]|uniref:LysR family transcriptional regulator n=1 Tax=Steroidobacter flavus TaxID=1842136 RepID=A0ABV8SZP7_9GAMM